MNPETIITKICNAIDQIIESSKPYKGLFPSILHPQTGDMLMEKPPKIPGQRDGDRAYLGSNLIHDEPLLATMNTLAENQSKPEYAEAVDRYLEHFAQNCTQTTTGLFPWGEHSFWHLIEERVGCSRDPKGGAAIHDHLRFVPLWLWQKLNTFNPDCVERFADGLDYHWTAGDGFEYIRHATSTQKRISCAVHVRVIFRVIQVFTFLIWRSRIHKTDILKSSNRFRGLPTTGGKNGTGADCCASKAVHQQKLNGFLRRMLRHRHCHWGLVCLNPQHCWNHIYPNWQTRCVNTVWFISTVFSLHPTILRLANSSVYVSARRTELSSACRFGGVSTVRERRVVRRCFVSVDGD